MYSKSNQQRRPSYSDEMYGSEQPTEKTIPFLRRLVDMLSENENVISFCPGSVKNGQVTLGRIVVHDRIKVENEILPRYFNHSSFASLRRQLNYFSFTRIGKGRQKGATYCNEGVVVIEDILRLRRRSTTSGSSVASVATAESIVTKSMLLSPLKRNLMSKVVSPKCTKSKREFFESSLHSQSWHGPPTKKVRQVSNESALRIDAPSMRPTLVSPVTSPLHTPSTSPDDAPQVSLDLTVPQELQRTISPDTSIGVTNDGMKQRNRSYLEDPDILAGCKALLSFSHGLRSLTA